VSKESKTQQCRRLVWAHPGLTSWELADISGMEYGALERRLPDLRRKGIVKTGPKRKCRVANKPCHTWFPAAEATSPPDGSGPEPLRRDRPQMDRALLSPPDPEVDRLLARGPLHGWITRQMIEDTKAHWAPRHGRAVTDHEAIDILQNVRRVGQVLMQIGEDSPAIDQEPSA
jgi:hypothetical protein